MSDSFSRRWTASRVRPRARIAACRATSNGPVRTIWSRSLSVGVRMQGSSVERRPPAPRMAEIVTADVLAANVSSGSGLCKEIFTSPGTSTAAGTPGTEGIAPGHRGETVAGGAIPRSVATIENDLERTLVEQPVRRAGRVTGDHTGRGVVDHPGADRGVRGVSVGGLVKRADAGDVR